MTGSMLDLRYPRGAGALLILANLVALEAATDKALAQIRPPEVWVAADLAVVRLPPSAFAELPAPLLADLTRRGCTVPQTSGARRRGNVIRGSFRQTGSQDWAVLCSTARVSTILVYWNGDPGSVDAVAAQPDAQQLMVVAQDVIGFTRSIDAAEPARIRRYHDNYGGPSPPPLTHDGIDDSVHESASVVWYWHAGRWLALTGAD